MDTEKRVNIQFTIDELNTMIEVLGKEPFMKVYKLIEKFHVESSRQLSHNQDNK